MSEIFAKMYKYFLKIKCKRVPITISFMNEVCICEEKPEFRLTGIQVMQTEMRLVRRNTDCGHSALLFNIRQDQLMLVVWQQQSKCLN